MSKTQGNFYSFCGGDQKQIFKIMLIIKEMINFKESNNS